MDFLEERDRLLKQKKMAEVAKQIVGRVNVLDNPARFLVKRGVLKRAGRFRTVARETLLFNDILVFAGPLKGGRCEWKQTLYLNKVTINSQANAKMKNSFVIQTPERAYVCGAANPKDKQEWMTELTNIILAHSDPLDSAMDHLTSLKRDGNQQMNDQLDQIVALLAAVKQNATPSAQAKHRLRIRLDRKVEKQAPEVREYLKQNFLQANKRHDTLDGDALLAIFHQPQLPTKVYGKRNTIVWTNFFHIVQATSTIAAHRANRYLTLARERESFMNANPDATDEQIVARLWEYNTKKTSIINPATAIRYYRCAFSCTKLLKQSLSWNNFDVFKLDECSCGHPLSILFDYLLDTLGLFDKFKIEKRQFSSFVLEIEAGYKNVPYHNRLHAADVLQNMACLLQAAKFKKYFSEWEIFAALLAAAIHDFKHPGTNNAFHVNDSTDLAILYNDQSVLENMHLAESFKVMAKPNCDLMSGMSPKQRSQVRETVINMVLSTDMKKHFDLHSKLDELVNGKEESETQEKCEKKEKHHDDPDAVLREHHLVYLQGALHCSDIANPAKPLPFYLKWTDMIEQEFFAQGDLERAKGYAISPMCDRDKPNKGQSQIGFISVIVQPLFRTYSALVPEVAKIVDNIADNQQYWKDLLNPGQKEKRLVEQETMTSIERHSSIEQRDTRDALQEGSAEPDDEDDLDSP